MVARYQVVTQRYHFAGSGNPQTDSHGSDFAENWDGWRNPDTTDSEWGAQSWNKQRGLLNWPFENKVTTPECVTSECSCCFHTCPSYTVQLVTVTPSRSFQVTEGNTITLSSCLIPSVAVDRTKLFVLRSGKFQIYSDAGAELFTWESDKLEYAGTTANRNREQDFMMSNPAEQNHHSDSEQSVHQWSTRMGGQIALDNSGTATEVYFSTIQGHIFRYKNSTVTELVKSAGYAFTGLTLQTYSVPGVSELQKRLYVSRMGHLHLRVSIQRVNVNTLDSWLARKGETTMDMERYCNADCQANANKPAAGWRLQDVFPSRKDIKGAPCARMFSVASGSDSTDMSLAQCQARYETANSGFKCADHINGTSCNSESCNCRVPSEYTLGCIHEDEDDLNEKVGDKWAQRDLWRTFATGVNDDVSRSNAMYTRMAYAGGKLFYVYDKPYQRSTVRSTSVTMAIPCDHIFGVTDTSLRSWVIDASDYGVSKASTSTSESLREGSIYADRLPWEFTAFKKAVIWGNYLVIKEMVCTKPQPPTTRPSQETCCTRKRVEAKPASVASNSNTGCTDLKDLVYQM